jgi:hypothetical protein
VLLLEGWPQALRIDSMNRRERVSLKTAPE